MFKRKNKADVSSLMEKLDKMAAKGGGKFESDPTEWAPTKDAAGNASAIVRFLPAKDENGEDVPFVKLLSHSVKNNGQWYIENCPTTSPINERCPVCDHNSSLWNSGIESNKTIASDRKRKTRYYGNIVVIQDKANPEAEGKVFKWGFGQKIMDKIIAMGKPEFDGETPVDVTDVYEGAHFYVKVEKVKGFPNYDKSKFGSASALFDGDDSKLKDVFNGMHPLKAITAADKFKTYDELEKKYNKVLGAGGAPAAPARNQFVEDLSQVDTTDDIPFDMPAASTVVAGDEDLDDFFNSLDE